MKKNSLFKVVGIVILLYAVLTYIFPTATSFGVLEDIERSQVDIFTFFRIIFEAFSGFFGIIIFVLLVGAFYGVLKKTTIYDQIVEFFSKRFRGREIVFLVATIVLVSLISALTGLEVGLFFIFPILISIIIALGYDKITALSATLGATVIGIYGSIFGGTVYAISNQMLGLDVYDGLVTKIVLYVLGLAVLLFFTVRHADKNFKVNEDATLKYEGATSNQDSKNKKDKAKTKNEKDHKVDEKANNVKEAPIATLLENEQKAKNSKRTVWPAIIVIDLVLLIFILGTTDWASIFGSNWFNDLYTSMMEVTIGGFPIFEKLFYGITAFGTWFSPLRLEYYSIMILIATLIIAIVYRLKPKYALDSFIGGIKEYVVPAFLTGLACTVFVLLFHYPVFNTIGTWIMTSTDNFNIVTTSIFNLLSSVFYVDVYYYSYYVITYVAQMCEDPNLYPLINVMFINLYGLAMLIAPTSVLLLTSLSHSEVTYKDWLKYAWKVFVTLLVVSLLVFIVTMAVMNNLLSVFVVLAVVAVVLVAMMIVGMWKVFTKASVPGWKAIIPVYNIIVLLKIAGMNPLFVILMLIPVVNIVAGILCYNQLAKRFGKGLGYTIGLTFLPFVFMLMLGFGNSTYNQEN